MLYSGIEIPNELIQAARDGNLVIIAGSGVSHQCPLELPLFDELTDRIRNIVDPYKLFRDKEANESPEQYLSYLEDENCNIRSACKTVLQLNNETQNTNEKILTNPLHEEILRLFNGQDKIRIITTNFDDCFENALLQDKKCARIYNAPALPLGNSFNGLIHLHGSVSDEASMILTIKDFGRAYISKGWASRFLVDVFNTYTALFVGYSCSDTLVDYLTRSISAEIAGHAYTLMKRPEDDEETKANEEQWQSRGVKTIYYQSYEQLPEIIKEWANELWPSTYERVTKIKKLASHNNELQSKDIDFLKQTLYWNNDRERLIFTNAFCRYFTGPDSFYLLQELDLYGCLFKEKLDKSEQRTLNWIVTNFAIDSWSKLQELYCKKNNGHLTRQFCNELIWCLSNNDVTEECLGFWISWVGLTPLFVNSIEASALLDIAKKCTKPEIILVIARILLEIKINYTSENKLLNNDMYFTSLITYADDDEDIDKFIDIIKNYTEYIGNRLFHYCLDQIEVAYSIQTSCWTKPNTFDRISFNFYSFSSEAEDEYGNKVCNALIKTAKACSKNVDIKVCAAECISSSCYLLVRFGIWMLYSNNLLENGLSIIEEKKLLEDQLLCEEVCQYAQESFVYASDDEKYHFISYLERYMCECKDKFGDYRCFNICNWLLEAIEYDPLISLRNEIQENNPDFKIHEGLESTRITTCSVIDPEDEVCNIGEENFTIETLMEMIKPNQQLGIFSDPYDQIKILSKRYPSTALSMIDDLLVKEKGADEIHLLRKLINAFDWPFLFLDSDKLIGLFEECLQNDELFCEAVHQIYNTIYLKDATYSWTFDQLKPFVDCILSKQLGLNLADNIPVPESNPTDWFILSIQYTIGRSIEIIACLGRLAAKEGRSEEFKIIEISLFNIIKTLFCEETPTAKCACAAIFFHFNIWYEYDDKVTEFLIPMLSTKDKMAIPSWEGIAHSRQLSPELWQSTEEYWIELFKSDIVLEQGTEDLLNRMYYQFSFNQQELVARIQKIYRCASCSISFCRTTYREIDHYFQSLDSEQILEEWDAWVKGLTYSLINAKIPDTYIQIIDELYNVIIRWILEYPILRSQLIKVLTNKKLDENKYILFVGNNSLLKIVNDSDLTSDEQAIYITSCLNHVLFFIPNTDLEQVIRDLLQSSELDKENKNNLEEALMCNGIFDI